MSLLKYIGAHLFSAKATDLTTAANVAHASPHLISQDLPIYYACHSGSQGAHLRSQSIMSRRAMHSSALVRSSCLVRLSR